MEYIYNFFAIIFGYIMNAFYYVLDLVGMPYLWLCIVLFAATTRLLFLPQKIRSTRKALLEPALSYEKKLLRKKYGSISKKDKERYKQYQKDISAIYKKYKVSTGNGCLTFILQLPIFVGLFRVVKEPFKYVPLIAALNEAEKANINDFFGLSLDALPQAFGAFGIIVPAVIFLCAVWRIIPSFINKTAFKNITFTILNIIQGILLTWMSFCFPIAISLYWIVTTITNKCIAFVVKRSLKNSAKIQKILNQIDFYISEEKAQEEFTAQNLANNAEQGSTN